MTPPGIVALGVDAARGMAGALLIDKPSGPTSHDVVAVLRRTLKTPRVGHTGTLDPLATGLLVMLIGGATRLAQFLATDEKEYVADIRLGVATPTYDAASLAEGVRSPMGDGDGRWTMDDGRWTMGDGRWTWISNRFSTAFAAAFCRRLPRSRRRRSVESRHTKRREETKPSN